MRAAKHCPVPPSPPQGGSLTVRSEGYMYGRECSTGGQYVAIPRGDNDGCGSPEFSQISTVQNGANVVSTYKVSVERSPPGGSLALVLTFTQPVSPATVSITGDVS